MAVTDAVEAGWSEGPPLEDHGLAEIVLRACTEAAALVGEEIAGEPPRDVTTAVTMLEDAAGWTVARLRAGEQEVSPELLVTITSALVDVRAAAMDWRTAAFSQVHAALGRMRAVSSPEQLIAMAPVELCRCGFDRALVTRLDGSIGMP
ncbi:MAG: hypothetical protein H0V81_11915, partial [Solirubrobacterales bacterium]|nr:hypothetical protein [Solirubrobacterales bacterium]